MLPGLLQGISRELGNGFKSFFKICICRDGIGHGAFDGMGGFRGRQDAFASGKCFRSFEDFSLFIGTGGHIALAVQFGKDGAHAMKIRADSGM